MSQTEDTTDVGLLRCSLNAGVGMPAVEAGDVGHEDCKIV